MCKWHLLSELVPFLVDSHARTTLIERIDTLLSKSASANGTNHPSQREQQKKPQINLLGENE